MVDRGFIIVNKEYMMWNVIKNFDPNVDEHIKLIKALSQEKTVFFVRKEYLEFEELDEE